MRAISVSLLQKQIEALSKSGYKDVGLENLLDNILHQLEETGKAEYEAVV